MTAPILDLKGISVRFGGIHALRAVDLSLHAGTVHALIGPNGAGKTTLVSVLSGELRPDAGDITLTGRSLGGIGPHGRSRLGLKRTYQITSLFPAIPVFENLLLTLSARDAPRLRLGDFFRTGARRRHEREVADILARFRLTDAAQETPATLSHGDRRRLELAMAIVSDPKVLLLDEPLAGLSTADAGSLIDLIRDTLKGDVPILLIEHDMDAVFALADVITVLVNGEVLMSGTPDAVRRSPAVQAAYLSEEDDF